MHRCTWLLRFLAIVVVSWSGAVEAQTTDGPPPLKPEELEQLAAPIALYPDSLLAQVFMASTYPLEVVEAARWSKANPKVTGDALETAMQQQKWDPSVKSLTAFPQVLTMMNEELDWTQKLGDAFLAQQKGLMEAVQRLRAKAQAEGNLESNEQQKVTVEPASGGDGGAGGQGGTGGDGGTGGSSTTIIQIEPTDPQVVYVPTYNPTTVYGGWPYPTYPPYSYYPPGYVATGLLSFGVGMAVGSALWGDCNWGGNDVNINVNEYNNFNKTDIKNGNWEHNKEHRKGVEYRDKGSRERYGKDAGRNSQSREQFRGRAEQGRQDIARSGAADRRGQQGPGGGQQRPGAGKDRGGAGQGQRAGQGQKPKQAQRPAGGQRQGQGGASQRPSTRPAERPRQEGVGQGRNPNAFKDVGQGNSARQASSRGNASRQSAQSRGHGGGGGGGGGRRGGGGGGGRGGGGGGRGGGRR